MKRSLTIITSLLVALAGHPAYAVCTGNNYRTPACPGPAPGPDPRHIRHDAFGNPLPDDSASPGPSPSIPTPPGPAGGGGGGILFPSLDMRPAPP
jgi:hypothetical protein